MSFPSARTDSSPRSHRRLIDCFLYIDQRPYRDLLELRVALLSDVVDRFVIVCSRQTFAGTLLPTVFPEELDVIRANRDRIDLVVLEPLEGMTPRAREERVRNALVRGLTDLAPDDLVMVSDIDEVPRPEVLSQLLVGRGPSQPVVLGLEYFNFKFDYRLEHGVQVLWAGPVVTPHASLGLPQDLRQARWKLLDAPGQVVFDAGWHFSFLTATDDVDAKLTSMFVPGEQEWHGYPDGIRSDRRGSVGELIGRRRGFHDHMYAGSVWAHVPLSALRSPALEELVARRPEFLMKGSPDDRDAVREQVSLAMWRLYDREVPKVMFNATDRELRDQVASRIRTRLRRLLNRRRGAGRGGAPS